MLTRLEVDGFKNLLSFKVDFGPFNCIVGPNGVGKSNIFDVIDFLSSLADHSLVDAALQIRTPDGEDGDIRSLFWQWGRQVSHPNFRIAARLLVNPIVQDDFGRRGQATATYLEYEIKVLYDTSGRRATLSLAYESLTALSKEEMENDLRFLDREPEFRDALLHAPNKEHSYISTRLDDFPQTHAILVHERDPARPDEFSLYGSIPQTLVSTATSQTPTMLAARREMQSWKVLALDPDALRKSDRLDNNAEMTRTGEHLPSALDDLILAETEGLEEKEAKQQVEEQVYSRIANRLAQIVPIRSLQLQEDKVNGTLTLMVEERPGLSFPARALSDGTLRFLALAVLAEGATDTRLLCIEEPENGLHPAKIEVLVSLLKEMARTPTLQPDLDNPFRQVIIATHSPVVIQLLDEGDLLMATGAMVKGQYGKPVRTLRCSPMWGTWRDRDKKGEGMGSLLAYLTAPENASIQLDPDLLQ